MKMRLTLMAFACLNAATATTEAQLLPVAGNPPAGTDIDTAPVRTDPFAGSHQPYPRIHAADVAPQPNDHVFRYRRDPRLVAGVEVAPRLSLEGGYTNLPERERIPLDPTRPADAALGLGERGFSNHLAAKYALPAGERLAADAKVGVAHSVRKTGERVSDTGLYLGAGARYKVDRNTTVTSEVSRHGNAAKTFGRLSKDGIKTDLKMGF